MKILLAVDGSDYTRKMLEYVVANRSLFDASHSYTLFHAQPPLPPHARSALGTTAVQAYHEEEAQRVLQPALATLKAQDLEAQGSWKMGSAGDAIAAAAREGGYDMIIMGSHGHKSLAQLVMGSVSTQVLAQCGVPVLLIR
ncbi:universal stress protein [Ramlibacter sp. G-1-2-2]|uniref:Universal stress protein n=1 Tax=Ramlibacter agri TaxID=2728837 RepID=A0A848H106_9BURK|nr:universal stress protein [Ramlibacter agri]NML42423.1 universal stress protein [Ramlibacter agri]